MSDDLTSVRDALFQGGKVPREEVTMPNGVVVEVSSLPLATRGKVVLECMTKSGALDEEGEAEDTLDLGKLGPILAVECTLIKGTDTKVFSAADIVAVGALDAHYMDNIVNVAMKLSGLRKAAVDDAKGNSSATPVSASPSVSPES